MSRTAALARAGLIVSSAFLLSRLLGYVRGSIMAAVFGLSSGLDDVMDMMDEVVDLILLYEVKELPPELSEQVEVISRCAELTESGYFCAI